MAGPPGRHHARDFLRWACRRELAHDIDIVRPRSPAPGPSVDAELHLAVARRFATDETLPLVDRVAGLFVLCYAQPLARIARLTTSDVAVGDDVCVQFGRTEVKLSEPIGRLAAELAANRRGRATTAAPERSPWLFVGAQPGRPISSAQLGLRLGGYGIDARAARTSLLLDLGAELAPVVLADLLGLSPITAARWVKAAGGEWSSYAAARARGSAGS